MKKFTPEQQHFINLVDSDLNNEIHEEQMIPRRLSFTEFVKRYQAKHFQKYGKKLTLQKA